MKIAGFIILAGLIGQARIFYLNGGFIFHEEEKEETVPPPRKGEVVKPVESKEIYVYITGEVKDPGLYSFPPRSLLSEVIEEEGGLTAKADSKEINPARIVEDGEKVKIVRKKGFFARIGPGKSPPETYILTPDEKEEIEVIREK